MPDDRRPPPTDRGTTIGRVAASSAAGSARVVARSAGTTGRWKAEAERLVLRGTVGSAVVRLPLVVSLDPEDRAVQRIKEGSRRHEPTQWLHDESRQPAMAPEIADALWRITSLEPDERAGIWQLPGPERLSRYEIARRVVHTLGLDPDSITPVPTPPDVDRPRHIDMRGDQARDRIDWNPARTLT